MGVTIESAYLGDERSRINVLSSLRSKASSDGTISVPVDSRLIPILQVGGEISLTKDEIREAKEKAVEACGGPNDSTCLEQKQIELQRQRLEEKEQESQSKANIVKGRRLTVTVVENGKKKTFEVPEGQTFEWGEKKKETPFKLEKSMLPKITLSGTVIEVLKYTGIVVGVFLYILNILVPFYMFKSNGYPYGSYIAAAIAVFIPYSGFVISFVFFGLRKWIENMPIPK
jgi:hypothetical protein